MRKVMVVFMAVFLCSLSAWSQASLIVDLGTKSVEDIVFANAERYFENSGMPLQVMPSGKYGYMCESPLLMAVVDVTPDNVSNGVYDVKEVDFLCGLTFWYGIESKLEEAGYDFVKEGNATLGNGDVVPQKTYEKGSTVCLVQTIDRNTKQIIFKEKATPKPKSKSKRRR